MAPAPCPSTFIQAWPQFPLSAGKAAQAPSWQRGGREPAVLDPRGLLFAQGGFYGTPWPGLGGRGELRPVTLLPRPQPPRWHSSPGTRCPPKPLPPGSALGHSRPRPLPAPQRTRTQQRRKAAGPGPRAASLPEPPERDIGRAAEPRLGCDTPGPSRERRTWWAGHTPKAEPPAALEDAGCSSGPRPLRPHRCPAGRALPGTPQHSAGPARPLSRPGAAAAGALGRCQAREHPALPRTGTDLRGSSRRHRRPGRAARRAQLRRRPPGSPQRGLDEAGGSTPAAGKHLPPRHPRHRGTGATGSAPAACPGLAPPPQRRARPRGIMGAVGGTRAPRALPRPFATTTPGSPLRPRGACWEMESAHSPAARGMAGVVVLVRPGGTPLPRVPRGGAGGRKFRCLAVGALGLARRPRLRRRRR